LFSISSEGLFRTGLLFSGCTEAPVDLPLRPQDQKADDDAVAFLKTTIENLPDSDPLIQRYGKLQTIEPSMEKTAELEASGYKPVVLADELWFGQDTGEKIHNRCSVGAMIRHPEFKP
jgi:hypothetical protein